MAEMSFLSRRCACFADAPVSPMRLFRRCACLADAPVSPMCLFRRCDGGSEAATIETPRPHKPFAP